MARTEKDIRAELDAALKTHREADHETITVAEAARNGQAIKALNAELAAALTEGAKPCRLCGNAPMGMLKTPEIRVALDPRMPDGPANITPAIYEVGCAAGCTEPYDLATGKKVTADFKGEKVDVRVPAGRGATSAAAVTAWNEYQK